MEQSCESTESGTATSRITPASPETGRGGYITRSKLSSQVIMSIVMIMMMVMIMDSGYISCWWAMIMTEGDDDWNWNKQSRESQCKLYPALWSGQKSNVWKEGAKGWVSQ